MSKPWRTFCLCGNFCSQYPLTTGELTLWYRTERNDCPFPRIYQLPKFNRESSTTWYLPWFLIHDSPSLVQGNIGNYSYCKIKTSLAASHPEDREQSWHFPDSDFQKLGIQVCNHHQYLLDFYCPTRLF